ncbi:alpha/beta family hydrolase [Frankia sp. CiP1_Cm_nod1]|uniref:alpha/beta family hydrolase n=1 Tax=Frankia sp. CiP1_Cm_nod1 TaxID=2897160 RepID=UPI0020257310
MHTGSGDIFLPGTTTAGASSTDRTSLEVDGARVFLVPATGAPAGTVVLLHGAASGTDVGVLSVLARRLPARGVGVARLEMPYRVAGRRAPDRPARLDAVLHAVMDALGRPRPVVLAGRSMGSRVACRCARTTGAAGVVAFGFPLCPPGRPSASAKKDFGRGFGQDPPGRPSASAKKDLEEAARDGGREPRGSRPSRLPELLAAGVPVLVLQGDRDTFGMPGPDPARHIEVHVLAGADHAMRTRRKDGRDEAEVVDEAAAVATEWIIARLASARP